MRSHVSSTLASFALAASCLAANAAPAASPKLPGPAFPSFADAKAVEAACQKGLAGANARVRKLEKHPPDASWLAALDDFNAYIEDTAYPVEFVLNVHPDKNVCDAAQACSLRWQDFSSTFGQNDKIYQAARKVKPRDAIDRAALRVTMESFEDSGVALPADKRARAKQLSDRISELGKQYDKAVRDDDTKVAFTVEELAGVPETVWKDKPRDDAGRVVLGLDSPSYLPVLERATSGATRERIYRAKLNEGGEGNLKLLAELVQLRREYAGLFGYKTFADFQLRRRMAGNVPAVTKFLDEVKAAVTEREVKDLELLRQAKAQHLKQPLDSTKIERWLLALSSIAPPRSMR